MTKKHILHTENPEQIIYPTEHVQIEILGGIRIDRLDSLRVTLKLVCNDSKQALRHNLDLYNDIQVNKLIRRAAGKLELGMGAVMDVLESLTDELETYRLAEIKANQQEEVVKEKELTKQEKAAALKFLKQENLIEKTSELIAESGVVGETTNALLMYLIFTSRKRSTPLHIISLGASGTGKSHLQEKVAELIPEEDKIEITDLSENAFYYFERNQLQHKLILIEDLDGADTAFYPLRELQSKKRISKTIVKKLPNGKTQTVQLVVEGPVSVAGCTTKEAIYEDNANRSFLIYIDDSKEQDEQIMNYQRQVSAGQIDTEQEDKIKELLKNTQRVLRPIKVINPYAPYLQIPTEVFKPRRTNNHYLQFVEAITFYHQQQREEKVNKQTGEIYIETTLEDIRIANDLMKEVLLRKSDMLTGACRKYFEKIKLYLIASEEKKFTNLSIGTVFRMSTSTVKNYHYQLVSAGYLKTSKEKGSKANYYEVVSYKEYEKLQTTIVTALEASYNDLMQSLPSTNDNQSLNAKIVA
jgi:hypothetical protein